MNKKVVNFNKNKETYIFINEPAIIFPINHPNCSNEGYAVTSKVLAISSDGSFETQNTFYIPMELENAC